MPLEVSIAIGVMVVAAAFTVWMLWVALRGGQGMNLFRLSAIAIVTGIVILFVTLPTDVAQFFMWLALLFVGFWFVIGGIWGLIHTIRKEGWAKWGE